MWNHFIKYKHVLLLPNKNHSMQTAKVWKQSVIGSVSDLPVPVNWQDLRMQYWGRGDTEAAGTVTSILILDPSLEFCDFRDVFLILSIN